MSNYNRKFDWEEAKRLRTEGLSYAKIGDALGVSAQAVVFAVNDKARARQRANHAVWQRENKPQEGTCPDCGGIASQGRYRIGSRCRECNAKHLATTVREDTLQCGGCRYWLPDEAFPHAHNRKSRRGRHAYCRPCQNVARALNRAANREREQAYNRERYAKRRALLGSPPS